MARICHTSESDVLDECCLDLYAAPRTMTRHYRPLLAEPA